MQLFEYSFLIIVFFINFIFLQNMELNLLLFDDFILYKCYGFNK